MFQGHTEKKGSPGLSASHSKRKTCQGGGEAAPEAPPVAHRRHYHQVDGGNCETITARRAQRGLQGDQQNRNHTSHPRRQRWRIRTVLRCLWWCCCFAWSLSSFFFISSAAWYQQCLRALWLHEDPTYSLIVYRLSWCECFSCWSIWCARDVDCITDRDVAMSTIEHQHRSKDWTLRIVGTHQAVAVTVWSKQYMVKSVPKGTV